MPGPGDAKPAIQSERPTDPAEVEEREARRGHRRQQLSARAIHQAILEQGQAELTRSSSALGWSGLTAGLSMGFSLIAEGVLRSHLPDTAWRPLITKIGYTVGFFIVVLGRQQLFTETTLTALLPALVYKDRETVFDAARLWAVVLLSNLAGALIIAWGLAHTGVFEPPVKAEFAALAVAASQGSFGATLLRAIFAGWLIGLMVWMLPAMTTQKAVVVFVLTYLVGIASLTHIIAGSIEVLYGVAAGATSWSRYLGGYLVPTLIGNSIGGGLMVGALNHAQSVSGRETAGATRSGQDWGE